MRLMRHHPVGATRASPAPASPASPLRRYRLPWATQASPLRVVLVITIALGILFAGCTSEDKARQLNRQGNEAYDTGDYQTALDRYQEAQVQAPDSAAYIYNAGNALHRLGQFDRAVSESQRATTNGPDDVRFRAYYALGNHYFRQDRLREARDAYKNALKITAGDLDAKFNLEVVQRLLDERKQQQQQQQQQDQGDQNQQNQQNQQGQGQGQQQGQQQQDQQQGQQQPGQQGQQQQGQQQGQQGQQQPGQQQPGGQPGQEQGQLSQEELEQALRDATAEFERTLSVESALRILDLVEQQRRLRQSQIPAAPTNQRDQ